MVFMVQSESAWAKIWPYRQAQKPNQPTGGFSLDFALFRVLTVRGRSPNEREIYLSGFAFVRFPIVDRQRGRPQQFKLSPECRHVAHSAQISCVEGHRLDRIQQTAAYSRSRIRKWSGLSIPPGRAVRSSGLDGRRLQGALLRQEHQRQLSISARPATRQTRTALKLPERWTWEELRHKLVLTPEEKRVIVFIIAALILGLGTKCYRDTHPQSPGQIEKKRPHVRKSQP